MIPSLSHPKSHQRGGPTFLDARQALFPDFVIFLNHVELLHSLHTHTDIFSLALSPVWEEATGLANKHLAVLCLKVPCVPGCP